jgi:uncharacterized membrane protein YqjE
MPAADISAQADDVSSETQRPTAGVLGELSNVLASARTTLSSILELISLEARRAGLALLWIIVMGVVAAICIVSAWLGLMAALAMWVISLGFPPIATVIIVALIQLIAAAMLIDVCIGKSRDLLFPATRRQVAGDCPVKAAAP